MESVWSSSHRNRKKMLISKQTSWSRKIRREACKERGEQRIKQIKLESKWDGGSQTCSASSCKSQLNSCWFRDLLSGSGKNRHLNNSLLFPITWSETPFMTSAELTLDLLRGADALKPTAWLLEMFLSVCEAGVQTNQNDNY